MDDHTLQRVIDLAVKTAVLKAKKEAILTQFSHPHILQMFGRGFHEKSKRIYGVAY